MGGRREPAARAASEMCEALGHIFCEERISLKGIIYVNFGFSNALSGVSRWGGEGRG